MLLGKGYKYDHGRRIRKIFLKGRNLDITFNRRFIYSLAVNRAFFTCI
jgi:hypothetical protein